MTPPSEPQKTQNILGFTISSNLQLVISYKHYHKQDQKQSEIYQTKRQNTKQTTKRGCIQNICTPPGRILFNPMAPVAETPHTQNGNGSKVSRKVCSK